MWSAPARTARVHCVIIRPLLRDRSRTRHDSLESIGAGAIQLAGARAPKNSDSGDTGHNRMYGAPVKKLNRLTKKPNIQQRKSSACRLLATDTLPLINSFVDHTVFYVGSQTPLQFVDILYRSLVNAILIFCSRLDSGLVHSSRWPKILKHFSKLLK